MIASFRRGIRDLGRTPAKRFRPLATNIGRRSGPPPPSHRSIRRCRPFAVAAPEKATPGPSRIGARRWFGRPENEPKSEGSVETRTVRGRDGIDFCVTLRNPGAPHPVLCLPGALGTGPSDFENLLRDNDGGLGPEFCICALDPRGLGGSARDRNGTLVSRDYPIDFYARDALDAARVMEALGFETYSVLGWSDGAVSAIHLASHPSTVSRVRNLVVWGGNAFVTRDDVEAWESLRDVRNSWSDRARTQKAAVHGGSIDRLQELNDAATDGWIRMHTDPETRGDLCAAVLHRVECPTAVLHGSRDVVCDASHARFLARHIPDAVLALFPGGKHNLHQKHAADFHKLVRGFLMDTMGGDEKASAKPLSIGAAASAGASTVVSTAKPKPPPAIDAIAYGFMGSKALSVALKLGVFDAIHRATTAAAGNEPTEEGVPATLDRIAADCPQTVPIERLATLLSACVALGLIDRRVYRGTEIYSLPGASIDQLVSTSKRYWGDYIVGQVDAQFYDRMRDLDATMLTGDSLSDGYEAWFEGDPGAARRYTLAQHNGSLATGYGLLRRLPELAEMRTGPRLLDVGGGSGAFSIAAARELPGAFCVVLDLPSVARVASELIAEEEPSVRERLSAVALSATAPDEWSGIVPDESFDVVLLSYVSGSVPADALGGLYKNAYRALKPGGIAVVHDFFVSNGGEGPPNAALWALAHVTVNPEGAGLRPGRVTDLLLREGFVGIRFDDMIPETTQLIVATKPG